MNKNWQGWSDTEVETLRALWAAGKTAEEIADALERSVDAVKGKLSRMREAGEAPPRRKEISATQRLENLAEQFEKPPLSRDELWRRKALRPLDTRSITGRLFGDPLPGESALDRERAGA